MSRYIPNALRLLVAKRAAYRCEYCRIPEKFTLFFFQDDHIISLKHGGKTESSNLARAYQICNENKGSDIATFIENPALPVRFFNPTTDNWYDYFHVEESGTISANSPIGAATIKILKFNHPESIIERRFLMQIGLYP